MVEERVATVFARYAWPRTATVQRELTRWEYAASPLGPEGRRPSPAVLDGARWHPAVAFPSMIQQELLAAGEIAHPYVGTGSVAQRWTSERTWWLRTRVPSDLLDHAAARAEIVCDGVDHDAWLWLDGKPAGEHHGMFGGPVLDVSDWLRTPPGAGCDEHELLVALRPAGNGQGKPGPGSSGHLVKAESYCRWVNNPDIMTTGIWRPVRLVQTGPFRLERPHVVPTFRDDGSCALTVEVEVLAADVQGDLAFVQRHGQFPPVHDPRFARPDTGRGSQPEPATVTVDVAAPDDTPVAHATSAVDVGPGRVWARLELEIPRPQVWWPSGIGEDTQPLYTVAVDLSGPARDHLEVTTGLRTITWERSSAPRTSDHWFDWTMIVDGSPTTVHGVNWMPMDLLRLDRDRYAHMLGLIKNAGISLVRVWGGGLLETDDFYELCDELGLMVWQDLPLNTFYECSGMPLDVWEQQVVWNVERLRNHPSLVLWCGGNEIDPYDPANAAVIGIAERTIADLDGTRPFVRSCSDPGDVHPYLECDTTWYHELYRQAPAITEWGGHTLPTVETLAEILPAQELDRPLDTLLSRDEAAFPTSHPALHAHWAEFTPDRIPRMLGRTRLFDDLATAGSTDAVLAVQLGAAELYQSVITDFLAGDSETRLLMPWVFDRPWPSVGMQAVDHSGRPTLGYHAIRRAFRPGALVLRPAHEALAPGEELLLRLGITPGVEGREVTLVVYDQDLTVVHRAEEHLVPGTFRDVRIRAPRWAGSLCLVATDPSDPAVQHVRVVRVSPDLADPSVREDYRSAPHPTAYAAPGSLRRSVAAARTELEVRVEQEQTGQDQDPHRGQGQEFTVTLINQGHHPAAFVRLRSTDPLWTLIPEDSGFWLAPGVTRRLQVRARASAELSSMTTRMPEDPAAAALTVQAWNT